MLLNKISSPKVIKNDGKHGGVTVIPSRVFVKIRARRSSVGFPTILLAAEARTLNRDDHLLKLTTVFPSEKNKNAED